MLVTYNRLIAGNGQKAATNYKTDLLLQYLHNLLHATVNLYINGLNI